MPKNNITAFIKKNYLWLIVAIALVALLTGFLKIPSLAITGINVMDISKGEYTSTDPFFNNETYKITLSPASNSQSLSGYYSPDIIAQLTGKRPEQGFTLDVTLVNETIDYHLSNTSYLVQNLVVACSQDYLDTMGFCVQRTYCGYNPTWGDNSYILDCKQSKIPIANYKCYQSCASGYTTKGVTNLIDPTPFLNYNVEVKVTLDDGTVYKTYITPNNQSGAIADFVRIQSNGGLQGIQYPATMSSQIVSYLPAGTSTIQIKDYSTFMALNNFKNTLVDGATRVNSQTTYNAYLSAFLSSTGQMGQYCSQMSVENASTVTSTKVKCVPSQPPLLPILTIYLNSAKTLKVHVPMGMPDILSASVTKVLAADKSEVSIQVKNTGETDTFELSLKCPTDVTAYSTKLEIPAGTTTTGLIDYQGAGIIQNCSVTAKSVNNPANQDATTVKLSIYPICSRTAPNNAAVMVFTERGCAFICPNYGTRDTSGNLIDVFDASCGRVTNYDRCNYGTETVPVSCKVSSDCPKLSWGEAQCTDGNCIDPNGNVMTQKGGQECTSENTYTSFHCTGIGKYTPMDNYMDSVKDGAAPFIPEVQPHKYFVASVDNVMVCQYMNEYGYKDGVSLDSLTFDYSLGYPKAVSETPLITTPPITTTPTPTQVVIQPPAGIPVPVEQQQMPTTPPAVTQEGTQWYIYLAVGVIVGLVVYYYMKKRR